MNRGRYSHRVALAGIVAIAGCFSPRAHAADIPGFPGWQSQTFGDTTEGSASIDANGVLTIKGAGTDTWERDDQFHIVYKPLKGDGSATTRLISAEEGVEWSKIGIMVRNDLENPAAAIMQLHMTTAHAGDYLVRGISNDDNSSTESARSGKDDKLGIDGANYFPREFPWWLKIERRGDRFTGYVSKDGQLWTPVTRALQIVMKDEIVAGPYVVSLDTSSLLTGTFDGKVTDVSNTLLKPEQAIPLQPDPVIATGGNNSVLLTWERVDHLGHPADGYIVYKAKPGETTFTKIKELAGDQTSFLDESVKNGESARYQVTTVVKIGDQTLESRTINGKLLEVTGSPDPNSPIKIGGHDYFSNILDGGGGLPYTEVPGSASIDANGVVTLKAAGWDIQQRADGGQALLTPVNGDFTFTARVLGAPAVEGGDVNEWAKFGIAVRESTLAESRYASMLVTPSHGIRSPHRRLFTTMWSDDRGPNQDEPAYPIYLRIQRRGDEIRMFTSPDGQAYTPYGDPETTVLPNLRQNVYVGLIGTSHDDDRPPNQVAQTKFDKIELTTP